MNPSYIPLVPPARSTRPPEPAPDAKPCAAQAEGTGTYGYTVTLGENRWEEFHVLLDGDRGPRKPGHRGSTPDFLEGPL